MDSKSKDGIFEDAILSDDEISELIGAPLKSDNEGLSADAEVLDIDESALSYSEIDDILLNIDGSSEFKKIEDIKNKLSFESMSGMNLDEFQSLLESDALDEVLTVDLDKNELHSQLINEEASDGPMMSKSLNETDQENITLEDLGFDEDFDFDLSELEDMDLEFINDVSVYDNVERQDPFVKIVKREEDRLINHSDVNELSIDTISDLIEDDDEDEEEELDFQEEEKGKKRIFGIIRGMSAPLIMSYALTMVLIVSIIGGVYIINKLKSAYLPNSEILLGAPIAVQSSYSSDRANFIYLDESDVENKSDYPFKIVKFYAGNEETVFYFNQKINWGNYNIKLYDDDNNTYDTEIRAKDKAYTSDRIRFKPINSHTKGIVLELTDKNTEEVMLFPIRFESSIYLVPQIYLNTKSNMVSEGESGIRMENASFNFSGSSVNYKIYMGGEDYYNFERITVDSGTNKKISEEDTRFYIGDDTIVGNAKIAPMGSLSGTVNINFENIYRITETSATINPSQLFIENGENEITYISGDYTVVLERLGKMGPYFVLVLYGEDEDGERTEVQIESELNFITDSGEKISIPGMNNYGNLGTDIIFDSKAYADKGLDISNITSLNIKSTKIKVEDISRKVDLSSIAGSNDMKSEDAIESGIAFLKEKGFEQAENIFYSREANSFEGVFRTLRADQIENYLLKGEYSNKVWNFHMEPAMSVPSNK